MFLEMKRVIAKELVKISKLEYDECLNSIEFPKNEFGDLSSTISFMLAKKLKTNPVSIAKELSIKFSNPMITKTEALGPYLNFHFNDNVYIKYLSQPDNLTGSSSSMANTQKISVEFPSVNPNKPWHAGHLRNAILGDTVSRVLKFRGYNVEKIDYINDFGLQVAQSLWSYLNLNSKVEGKFDHWLGKEYVKIAKKLEGNDKIKEEVFELLHQLENGDNEISRKGRWLTEQCVKAQYETAFKLGIYHDLLIFESDIMHFLFKNGMDLLKNNSQIKFQTDGFNKDCYVFDLDPQKFKDMKSNEKVLIRSNGIATYSCKDVLFQMWKFGVLNNDLKFMKFIDQPSGNPAFMSSKEGQLKSFGKTDKIINVIGMEQIYPQQVVKEILCGLNLHDKMNNYVHLSYNLVSLPDNKISGRKGTWIGTTPDDLINEGVKRALTKVKQEFTDSERMVIANEVAKSAIRFSLLKVRNDKQIIFKWDSALNMKGDSAPYLMYAYVRCGSILSKVKQDTNISNSTSTSTTNLSAKFDGYVINDVEKSLIKMLAQFELVMERTEQDLEPHILCDYLIDLVSVYNKFYNECKVFTDDEISTTFKVNLVKSVREVLSNGFDVLGIGKLDKM